VELNARGAEALAQGDLETAGARLSVALEYNPEFVDALSNLGLVEMQRGNFDRAQQLFERVLRLNADIAQAHHGLGVLAERKHAAKRAAAYYRAALRIDPGFAPARANLGRLLLRSGDANAALLEFQRLIEVEPGTAAGYLGVTECLLALDRTREARSSVAQATDQFPKDRGLTLLRARIAVREGDLIAARAELEPLVKAGDAYSVEALGWLSLLHLVTGDSESAVAAAKQALAWDPQQALPTYALALALDELEDPAAKAWLARAFVLNPGNPELQRRGAKRADP
jgi:tetratricopeptide (TPR) repeat protein